ncbi:sensor histidine kinase [Rathayibacter sp. AY2B3]|uniref:sensor histidine kinase n=1 Tax=Rathayibacter sp. AY2B3 TaxID=2080569 RepID=UPI000CE82260|nr:HAMP domain-containing sensor histidine kinase [Rathayibacter sp. AY2B3]PPG51443.1 sensor histidine kinase [Rathayibacter sp. AY2B3]
MRLLRSLSIRSRITLGSLLVALIGVGATTLVLHAQFRSIVVASEVTLAEGDLAPYLADLRSEPTETPDPPAEGILIFARAPGGAVPVDTMPHDVHEVLDRSSGNDGASTVVTDEDVRFTVVSRTLDTGAGTWELWAARSGAGSDLTVAALDRTLLVSAAALVILSALAAWLLTGVALRPVERMRRTAASLGDRDGGELPVGSATDELSDLAETLNAFLARTRDTADRERQMVSAASHEIRTPLAVVITQLELAHRHFGDADALETEIRAAEGSLARLSRLATNLLELSRLDAAPPVAARATARELETELMDSVDRLRTIAGGAGPEIELDTAIERADAPYPLSASAFSRILDNLGANAIAATPPGGHITLRLRQHDSGLELHVEDTGHGVPEEFVPHAFERFSRPDEARTSRDGGSGLGLALVAALVDTADGSVALENRSSGGVAVTMVLPER